MKTKWPAIGLACVLLASGSLLVNRAGATPDPAIPAVRVTAKITPESVRIVARSTAPFTYSTSRPSDRLIVIDLPGAVAAEASARADAIPRRMSAAIGSVPYTNGTRADFAWKCCSQARRSPALSAPVPTNSTWYSTPRTEPLRRLHRSAFVSPRYFTARLRASPASALRRKANFRACKLKAAVISTITPRASTILRGWFLILPIRLCVAHQYNRRRFRFDSEYPRRSISIRRCARSDRTRALVTLCSHNVKERFDRHVRFIAESFKRFGYFTPSR